MMKSVITLLSFASAAIGFLLWGSDSQGMPAVQDSYAGIFAQVITKRFDAATIWYVDPKVTTRTAVTPQTLVTIGCQIILKSDAPKWASLVSILEAENPETTVAEPAEVRWGIGFHGPAGASGQIFFGAYYGPESEALKIFGYVNSQEVYFSGRLPRDMTAFIQGMTCAAPLR